MWFGLYEEVTDQDGGGGDQENCGTEEAPRRTKNRMKFFFDGSRGIEGPLPPPPAIY